jgi:hypothetical protein
MSRLASCSEKDTTDHIRAVVFSHRFQSDYHHHHPHHHYFNKKIPSITTNVFLTQIMFSSILLSAFAAAVAADSATIYTMAFDVGDAAYPDAPNPHYIPAVLASNGTDGTYVLKGERPSVYTGTLFEFVGNAVDGPAPVELLFIDGYNAGAQVPEVGNGSVAAYAGPILAVRGSQGDARWFERNGFLDHVKLALGQDFFACHGVVQGEKIDVLSWGVEGPDGELPAGCRKTNVILRQ